MAQAACETSPSSIHSQNSAFFCIEHTVDDGLECERSRIVRRLSLQRHVERDRLHGFPKQDCFSLNSRTDSGDAFKALRRWARGLDKASLAEAGGSLDESVRRVVFEFILRISKRPYYRNQSLELLEKFAAVKEWHEGENVVSEESLEQAFGDRRWLQHKETAQVAPVDTTEVAAENSSQTDQKPTPPLSQPDQPNEISRKLSKKHEAVPPPEAFANFPNLGSFRGVKMYDAGDTFRELRKWVRNSTEYDIAAIGDWLDESERRDVIRFIAKICVERKVYKNQGRELLRKLLSVKAWVKGEGVVDEWAVHEAFFSNTRSPKSSRATTRATSPASEQGPPYYLQEQHDTDSWPSFASKQELVGEESSPPVQRVLSALGENGECDVVQLENVRTPGGQEPDQILAASHAAKISAYQVPTSSVDWTTVAIFVATIFGVSAAFVGMRRNR